MAKEVPAIIVAGEGVKGRYPSGNHGIYHPQNLHVFSICLCLTRARKNTTTEKMELLQQ